MSKSIKSNFIFIFITSAAMALSGWAIVFLIKNFPGHYKKLNSYLETTAVVLDSIFLESNGSRRSGILKYQITYSYNHEGTSFEKSEVYLKPSFNFAPSKGDSIQILINPNDKNDVRIKPKAPVFNFILFFTISLIIFISSGWVWVRSVKRLVNLVKA